MLQGKLIFHFDEFDQRNLVERIDVVDGTSEIPQQFDEAQLPSHGGVEEGS